MCLLPRVTRLLLSGECLAGLVIWVSRPSRHPSRTRDCCLRAALRPHRPGLQATAGAGLNGRSVSSPTRIIPRQLLAHNSPDSFTCLAHFLAPSALARPDGAADPAVLAKSDVPVDAKGQLGSVDGRYPVSKRSSFAHRSQRHVRANPLPACLWTTRASCGTGGAGPLRLRLRLRLRKAISSDVGTLFALVPPVRGRPSSLTELSGRLAPMGGITHGHDRAGGAS